MSNTQIILPIIIPLLTGVFCLFARDSRVVRRWLSLLGSLALLVAGISLLCLVKKEGIQASQMGGWPAPFGITLVADLFSSMMVVVAGIIGFVVSIYSFVDINIERKKYG